MKVSRAGFYAWSKRPESAHAVEDRQLAVLVRAAHERSRRSYGSPRVHAELKANGLAVARKRVARLMRESELKARARKRFRPMTMDESEQQIAPNLLDREFHADAPNQRWIVDTTYLQVPGCWLYLAVVIDLFSRMVVGWSLSAVNDRHLVLRALEMAVKRRCPGAGLLHHSDQGSQYASEDYRRALEARGITCSMSRRGNCLDNAVLESWNKTLKAELGERFESPAVAKEKLFDYIEVFYNQQRRHSTLGYLSPAAFERVAREQVA
jgi:transposase InsO family protein